MGENVGGVPLRFVYSLGAALHEPRSISAMAHHVARLIVVTILLICMVTAVAIGNPFGVLIWGLLALAFGWPFVKTGELTLHYSDDPLQKSAETRAVYAQGAPPAAGPSPGPPRP